MSFNDTTTESDGDDEPAVEDLAARVRDLEVEVYGYDPQRSAGEQVATDVKRTVVFLEDRFDDPDEEYRGVPLEAVYRVAEIIGVERSLAKQAYSRLKRKGEVYEPADQEVATP